jgi:hypothetical protein
MACSISAASLLSASSWSVSSSFRYVWNSSRDRLSIH